MRYTQDSGVKRVNGTGESRVVVTLYLTDLEANLWGARVLRPSLTGRPLRDAGGQVHFLHDTAAKQNEVCLYCACRERFGSDLSAATGHLQEVSELPGTERLELPLL